MGMPAEAEPSPSAYEGGGAGGKLRASRRAHRLRLSTPYDRPPIAFRNSNNGERNGWISKFVDPASRIITNSAARLFSSVFHKRLAAPPSTSETNLVAGHGLPEENSSLVEEQRSKDGENINNNHDSNGIDELEQLLKQKTFTRVEFDHLTELLRSRTVDVPMEIEGRRADPSTSQPVVTWKRQENSTATGLENGEGRIMLGNVSTHEVGLSVGKQPAEQPTCHFIQHICGILGEDALPTELAKAYMGSRPSKVSPSSLGTRGRTFKQDPCSLNIVPYAPKSPIVSTTSPSVRHNSGVPGLIDPWSTTPRPRNRSALYNMSRVPYSGIGSAATIKGIYSNNDGYVVPSTSSDWTQGNNFSGVSQVLKRSNSALGDDFGSGGPVRRIRQKYNMVSPSKDEPPISSIQRPILSDGRKYGTSNRLATENGHKHISNATFPSVPAQSTEMARKILQQLDKLVPSPKEKSSEQKLPVNREKSPAKLTLSMLSGRALRSMEDIESIKLPNKDTPNAMLNGSNGSNFADTCRYTSQKQDGVIDNGPTKTAAVAVKLAAEVEAVKAADPLVKSTKSDLKPEDSFVSGFDANSGVKRAFQMCAPEDYVDLDDDSCTGKDASIPQPAEEKPKHSVVNQTAVVTETVTIGKPLISTTESGHVQHGVEAISGASNGPIVNAKDAAPTAISPTTLSSPCPLPSAQLLSNFNGSVPLKCETAMDMFGFVSKVSDKVPSVFTSSSMTRSFSSSLGQEEDAKSESNLKKISSSAAVISVEGAGLDKGDKSQPEGEKHTALQNPASSGMLTSATSTVLSFGASTNSSLSNGSPNSTISKSVIPPSPIFCNASSSISSSSSSSATSSSVFTPSLSAVPPPFPVGSLFKFGSSTMAAASSGIASQLSTKSGLESSEAEPKDKQAHPFNMPVSSLKPSSAFPTSGSGIFSFNSSTSAGTTNPSSASSQSQGAAFCTSNAGSVFGSSHATAAASSITPFTESASSQFGSSSSSASFGLGGSAFNLTSSSFGCSAPSAKPFGLASDFGLGSSTSTSLGTGPLGCSSASFTPSGMASSFLSSSPQSASLSSSEFVSVSSSPAPPGFSFVASAAATSSGSVPGFSFEASTPGTSTGSTPVFSFGASAPATSSGSTPGFPFGASAPATSSGSSPGFPFGASAPASFSGSTPGFPFGASAPATSSGSKPAFSFGASIPAMSSGSSTPLPFGSSFGASSGSMFSFTSAAPGSVTSMNSFAPSQPVFGVQNAVASFGCVSAGNDQMNEDIIAEDTIQASSAPVASPVFGQSVAVNSTPPSNFSFGSPAVAPSGGVFQFGSHQNPTPQAPSPFSATGTLPGAGGSFSLGTGGSDKANRRIVKVKHKPRKK